jgi:hypothetical protein
MVMVRVPVVARVLAVSLRVEEPEPGAATDVGVKVAVTPDGRPLADKPIAELKPFSAAVVTVVLPDFPRTIVNEVGDALMEKSAVGAEVTVRVTVVVWLTPPPEPVTVI